MYTESYELQWRVTRCRSPTGDVDMLLTASLDLNWNRPNVFDIYNTITGDQVLTVSLTTDVFIQFKATLCNFLP